MTLPDKILITLYNSNQFSSTLFNEIVARDKNGEQDIEFQNQFILLGEWIRILQNYYTSNFNAEGNVITPNYACLTQSQIEQLMSKLKLAIGNNKYPIDSQSLQIWSDDMNFFWDDNNIWLDEPTLN